MTIDQLKKRIENLIKDEQNNIKRAQHAMAIAQARIEAYNNLLSIMEHTPDEADKSKS